MLSLRRAELIAQSIKSKWSCELYIFWVHILVIRNQYDFIFQCKNLSVYNAKNVNFISSRCDVGKWQYFIPGAISNK